MVVVLCLKFSLKYLYISELRYYTATFRVKLRFNFSSGLFAVCKQQWDVREEVNTCKQLCSRNVFVHFYLQNVGFFQRSTRRLFGSRPHVRTQETPWGQNLHLSVGSHSPTTQRLRRFGEMRHWTLHAGIQLVGQVTCSRDRVWLRLWLVCIGRFWPNPSMQRCMCLSVINCLLFLMCGSSLLW